MATLMTGRAETGLSNPKFVRRRASDGAWWSTAGTPAFEAYNAANIANYGVAATETGVTGVYTATDPADTVAGDYALVASAGASLTVADVATGTRWVGDGGDVFTRLGAPAGASVSADVASIKTDTGTLVTRITSTLFSGITYLSRWLGAIAGKTADASTQTEIRATTAGASYTITTDSLEAQADAGAGGDPLENEVPGDYEQGTAGYALGRIGTGVISTVSPVSQGGDVSLTRGDSYYHADARALSWTGESANVWPDLTGATISLNIGDGTLVATGSVVTPTGTQVVRCELTAVQTALLSTGTANRVTLDYDLKATLASGATHVVTLARGKCVVTDTEAS